MRIELKSIVEMDLIHQGEKLSDYIGKDLKNIEVFNAYDILNRMEGCGYNLEGMSTDQIEKLYWSELEEIISSEDPFKSAIIRGKVDNLKKEIRDYNNKVESFTHDIAYIGELWIIVVNGKVRNQYIHRIAMGDPLIEFYTIDGSVWDKPASINYATEVVRNRLKYLTGLMNL